MATIQFKNGISMDENQIYKTIRDSIKEELKELKEWVDSRIQLNCDQCKLEDQKNELVKQQGKLSFIRDKVVTFLLSNIGTIMTTLLIAYIIGHKGKI